MLKSKLQFNEVYYLVLEDGTEHLQGRFQWTGLVGLAAHRARRIVFITHNGSMAHEGYRIDDYKFRPATRKEKFRLWLKGELPRPIIDVWSNRYRPSRQDSFYPAAMIEERGE